VAVIKHAARSLRPGVVSAPHFGDKYSSSSLDKSYGSKDDGPSPEAFAEGKKLLC